MRLPTLSETSTGRDMVSTFLGLNRKLNAGENEFTDMQNMTSEYVPYLSPRAERKVARRIGPSTIDGICTMGKDVYTVQGQKLYKNGYVVDEDIQLSKGKKDMFGYGAYIVIMPDKVMYNTETSESARMTYEKTMTAGGTLYLSDKNGVRYAFLPETGDYAKVYTKTSGKEADLAMSELLNFTNPAFVKNITSYYDDGTSQELKNALLVFGSKIVIEKHSSRMTYESYFGDISSDNKIELKSYNAQTGMWNSPELYVTWWITTSEAEQIEKSIKTGDFISFNAKDANGKEIEKNSVKDSYWNLIEHFNGYVKVENVLRSGNEIGIVFSNQGIDFLQVLQDTDGYLKYGNTALDTASETGAETTKSVYSLTPSIGFPWSSGSSICSSVTLKKDMPDMDFLTVSNNRIWGCSNEKHEIYACKLGDPTSWYCYAGLSSDSYAVTIGSEGEFTGACTFNDYPYFFKENLIICIYGNRPKNYQMQEIKYKGVEKGSDMSIAYRNSYMYYKSKEGIVRFNGSSTTIISEVFGAEQYKDAKAMICDDKYFVAMKDYNGKAHLFVYDLTKGMWHIEDNYYPEQWFSLDGNLYGVENSLITRVSGKCVETSTYLIENNENLVIREVEDKPKWYVESGDFDAGDVLTKYISKLMFKMSLEEGASITIALMYDSSGEWERVYTTNQRTKKNTFVLPIIPKRCDHMKYRIEGTGMAKIFSMVKTIEMGSEVH